jgi:Type I restriction enzyme R protein N terminus (HSDR_N)
MQINIDLSSYSSQLRLKKQDGKRLVFDPLRKKFVALTPEEFVRQLLITYLLLEKKYNPNRMASEKSIEYNGMSKRFDLAIFDKHMNPFLLAECKSADQAINLSVFEQISRYNSTLQVPYLLVTNGLEIHCCQMNYEAKSYDFITEVPNYPIEKD